MMWWQPCSRVGIEKPRGPVKILSNDKDVLYWIAFGALVRDHFADESGTVARP